MFVSLAAVPPLCTAAAVACSQLQATIVVWTTLR